MNWNHSLDHYCERTDPSFWSEPLNAVSNGAFLVAAFVMAIRAARVGEHPDRPVLALSMLVGLIGIGSFLFHTFATRWALAADVLPIIAFIHLYFYLAMRRFFSLSHVLSIVAVLLFLGLSFMVARTIPNNVLNGSGGYVSGLLAMLTVGVIMAGQNKEGASWIILGVVAFTTSLTFRTLDGVICGAFPFGTHFLWHILNAVTLYLLLYAAMKNRRDHWIPRLHGAATN